jgi:hypothetical protein
MSISYTQVIHRQISYPQARDSYPQVYISYPQARLKVMHRLCTGVNKLWIRLCTGYTQAVDKSREVIHRVKSYPQAVDKVIHRLMSYPQVIHRLSTGCG